MLGALRIFEDGLRDGYVFTADQLCEKDPSLDHDRAEAVLRELAVAIGSLPPESYTGLYDQNPLRERPFLEFGGEYMLALPGSVTRDVDTLLEGSVLAADPAFSRRRCPDPGSARGRLPQPLVARIDGIHEPLLRRERA